MNCTFPPALSDGQLLTYMDGVANREISTHIAGCAACRARAQELDLLQKRLSAGLFRVVCPPSLELGEYQAGLLEAEEAERIRQHLVTCHHCTSELSELQTYLEQLPPVFEVDRWQQIKTQTRLLVARLADTLSNLGGSGFNPAPVSIRGEQEAQLVYEADDVQVILEVQQDAEQIDRKVILGLVLEMATTQAVVAHLWKNDQVIATVTVDESGNFIFSGLTSGRYELVLNKIDVEIYIQDLLV